MELLLSITAISISFFSIFVSVIINYKGTQREKKQATLDAFNVLQEQVFDNVNEYTNTEIREICDNWKSAIKEIKNRKETEQEELGEDEKHRSENCLKQYRILTKYLARIEHFALGVNSGIYDARIAERAATSYLVILYRKKLKPLIEAKHSGDRNIEYYAEFRKLVELIEKFKIKKV